MEQSPIYRHVTTKTKDKGEYIKKDEFIISVAKGKTRTIKQTFTLSLSTMVSGSYYDKAELGFKNAISLTKKLILIQGLRTAKAVIAKNIG